MQQLRALIRNPFRYQIVAFLVGAASGAIINVLTGTRTDLAWGVVLLLVVLLIVLVMAVMRSMQLEISELIARFGLSVQTFQAKKTEDGDQFLYDPIIPTIAAAERSLLVVGLYRPQSLVSSTPRRQYYQAIENLLERHHQQQTQFHYERIVQVETVEGRKLRSSQVDPVTFDHCKRLLEKGNRPSSVDIRLLQIPNVLGALSFFIVDNREVVFALPGIKRDRQFRLQALQLGTAVIFTDYDGALVDQMLTLFDDLRRGADEVNEVIDAASATSGTAATSHSM